MLTLFSLRRNAREAFGQNLYHNVFDISQSQLRIVRLSKVSSKKSFAMKLFQFCDVKTQQLYILLEQRNIFKRELSSLVDNLRHFLRTSDNADKCLQVPLPKPKIEIGSTKSKKYLFAHYYNDFIDHPNRQIRLSIRVGNNNSCPFPSKSLNVHSYRKWQP